MVKISEEIVEPAVKKISMVVDPRSCNVLEFSLKKDSTYDCLSLDLDLKSSDYVDVIIMNEPQYKEFPDNSEFMESLCCRRLDAKFWLSGSGPWYVVIPNTTDDSPITVTGTATYGGLHTRAPGEC